MDVLYDSEVCSYINKFDFIVCIETFKLTVPDSLSNLYTNHELYSSPAINVNDAKTARLSGGVIVMIKKSLSDFVERVHVEFDNTVAIKINGSLFKLNVPVVLIATYLPPAGSPYYDDMDIDNGVVFF